MDRSDILFKNHLHYQIEANAAPSKADPTSTEEINSINLRNCTFLEFKKVLTFISEHNPDYDFSKASLDTIKPTNYYVDKKYDFIALTNSVKNTALVIGNLSLLNELQKIAGAEEYFINQQNIDDTPDTFNLSFESFMNLDINDYGFTEELGSCIITGSDMDTYRLTATFHDSSRKENPLISIRIYSIKNSSYLSNRDIIAINSIYKPNATLMEAFAYMSFYDYRYNRSESSFNKILNHLGVDINSIEDMYSRHYDLRIFDELSDI